MNTCPSYNINCCIDVVATSQRDLFDPLQVTETQMMHVY